MTDLHVTHTLTSASRYDGLDPVRVSEAEQNLIGRVVITRGRIDRTGAYIPARQLSRFAPLGFALLTRILGRFAPSSFLLCICILGRFAPSGFVLHTCFNARALRDTLPSSSLKKSPVTGIEPTRRVLTRSAVQRLNHSDIEEALKANAG